MIKQDSNCDRKHRTQQTLLPDVSQVILAWLCDSCVCCTCAHRRSGSAPFHLASPPQRPCEATRWKYLAGQTTFPKLQTMRNNPTMTSAAETYLRALQALSGDTDLSAARKALLSGIDEEDILVVALHVVSTMLPRCEQEELILFALDKTARSQQSATLSNPRYNSRSAHKHPHGLILTSASSTGHAVDSDVSSAPTRATSVHVHARINWDNSSNFAYLPTEICLALPAHRVIHNQLYSKESQNPRDDPQETCS